jgi:hypothetical protein
MERNTKQKIDFDDHEDYRFPISLLNRAYWVLENHGYEKFRRYVARVDMPVMDIERVMNKHQYYTVPKVKAKIDAMIKKIKDKIGVQISID